MNPTDESDLQYDHTDSLEFKPKTMCKRPSLKQLLMTILRSLLAFLIVFQFATAIAEEPDTPHAINTQAAGQHPPSAEQSAASISVPSGFNVALFAGDPHVHQPIAFDIDDRGRLWVIECFTYEGGDYDLSKRDRILIFEDTDGDGRFDHRKIFWDQGQRLTGLTLGFGGVWLTSAPNLLFLPDRNHDDTPDGEPKVLLEGFSILARHNMVNGLRWGPDGWLYGRHGITDTSNVGTPETPLGKRVRLNCSIWRYHPLHKTFEVVVNGTTNPWGLDYDDHGQWFFTNNVINHLWHVVPGAHYQRMHGDDFNQHLYELIQPTADHFHWDTDGGTGEASNKNRKQYDGRHDSHGGGHSHAGGMIYLGDNFPPRYRGLIMMCNTHGRRVNVDRLVRQGNSYVATHQDDFLMANNEWFRGVELKYGPDGGVFLTDWSDLGECHDRDGVHRTSGRIYKITHGRVNPRVIDLPNKTNEELAELQLHANDWIVRHSRRLLQERSSAGGDLSDAEETLRRIYQTNKDVTRRLRAMWALYSIGVLDDAWLNSQLSDRNEHIRVWAVRLLADDKSLAESTINRLGMLAKTEPSGLVRLFLASTLQRMDPTNRWMLANHLAQHGEDSDDRVQPLMIWYGIEAAVAADTNRALSLAAATRIPLIRKHIARRLTENIDDDLRSVTQLVSQASGDDIGHAADYLKGMAAALRGRHRVTAPENWKQSVSTWSSLGDRRLAPLYQELSVVFGDGRAVDELLAIACDVRADANARHDALRVILDSGRKDMTSTLLKLKNDRVIGAEAIRGLARYENPEVPRQLLSMYGNAKHEHRPAIISTLASRPSYAHELLKAVAAQRVSPQDISAADAANIAAHQDEAMTAQLEKLWGSINTTPDEKLRLIARYRAELTSQKLAAADQKQGKQVFQKICGNCHKMFGQGKSIGPDLTGSNRDNLDYLLENIIDPSRVVPAELRQSAVLLTDGRIINGTIMRQNDNTLTIQAVSEEVLVSRKDVETVRGLPKSLMPDGLLTQLTEEQVTALFAYLKNAAAPSPSRSQND